MRAVLLALVCGAAIWVPTLIAVGVRASRVQAIGICLGAEPICIGSHARCICDGMNNCHWECVR